MRDLRRRPMGRLCYWVLAVMASAAFGAAACTAEWAGYDDRGGHGVFGGWEPAQGNLIITWPAFVTASGAAVAAGTTNTALGANGALSVALVPNAGATPAGVYYTVVYQIGPGQVKTEYWVVPTTSPANLAAVRTTPGAGVAGQPVSLQYVNSSAGDEGERQRGGASGGDGDDQRDEDFCHRAERSGTDELRDRLRTRRMWIRPYRAWDREFICRLRVER